MTTFFNYENPELFGLSSYMPEFPVSSIVDNIIVLSLVELGTTLPSQHRRSQSARLQARIRYS